jgi:hypothetical protein
MFFFLKMQAGPVGYVRDWSGRAKGFSFICYSHSMVALGFGDMS